MNAQQYQNGLLRLIHSRTNYPFEKASVLMQSFETRYYKKHRKEYTKALQQQKMGDYTSREQYVFTHYAKMLAYQRRKK